MKSVMNVEPEERSSNYMTRLVQRFGYQAIAARSTAAARAGIPGAFRTWFSFPWF